MRSEGYSTWSARKLGSNLLCQGGKMGEEKGERKMVKGQNEEGNFKCHEKRKGRKAMDEQQLFLLSFFELGSCFGMLWR